MLKQETRAGELAAPDVLVFVRVPIQELRQPTIVQTPDVLVLCWGFLFLFQHHAVMFVVRDTSAANEDSLFENPESAFFCSECQ